MNVLLFGGFLGSGKTSIILHFAEYLVPQSRGAKCSGTSAGGICCPL
ncbi:hypothetical protein [Desulfosporosinus fructosivorans]